MAPAPPHELVRELLAYDPLLRVRWGVHQHLWTIERKLPERHRQLLTEKPNPWKSPRGLDLYEGWRQGYVHVLNVHPSLIDNVPLVLGEILRADIWRTGGIEAVLRELDAADEAEEAAFEKELANWSEAATSDAYDRYQWLEGHRVAMTPPADRSHEVVEREGYLVTDRRRVLA